MTETEWLFSRDATKMLAFLRRRGTQRQFRLFGVACCRSISQLLVSAQAQQALDLAEQFADGLLSASALRSAYNSCRVAAGDFAPDESATATIHRHAFVVATRTRKWALAAVTAEAQYLAPNYAQWADDAQCAFATESTHQCALLRDIFGNPFRPVAFNPAWRTDTALTLARQMYDSRDFGAMPILADALQDAGCDNPAILDHCRDANQPHVRGCWVCDLVLGLS